MSLQWQLPREIPPELAQLGQSLFPLDNFYRQIGDRFDRLFPPEAVFEELYTTQGRSAISPLLLALVTVFQMLEKVPDRTAAEYVVSRLDWKYALHLPLRFAGFHFTDLYAFRGRLLAQHQERLVFEQLLERLKTLGILHPKGQVRTDSTAILGLVERLSQLELVAESLRLALQAVGRAAPGWVREQVPWSFQEAYAQRVGEYGLSDGQVQQRLRQVGQDAFWLVGQVERAAPPGVAQLPEVVTLRQVLAQQFPGGSGTPPVARRPMGEAVVESPHEPEARRGQKRGHSWIGYKGQVSESCDATGPHLVIDLEPGGALVNDSEQLAAIQTRLAARGLTPRAQYVDQGYMSGAHLYHTQQAGGRLMGLPLADTQGPAGFQQTDFQIQETAQQAICPAGQPSQVWSEKPVAEAPQPHVAVRFAGATCQACAFWGRCTSSPQGRSLTLHPYRAVLAERRAEAQTEAFQRQMHVRAGIEATISELVRRYRYRYARYRGIAKLRLQGYFTAVAIDLMRLARWWAPPQTAG